MTELAIADCPPMAERAPPFFSLGEIDRIGGAFYQSPHNLQCIADVQRYRSFRMRCLGTTLAMVDACSVPERAAVSVRLKRLDSIHRKIKRRGTNFTLGRLDDVVGVRVICQDLSTVRDLSERICCSPGFYRPKDYIHSPAITGYRGIHHIMRFQQPVTRTAGISIRFEIQVRTWLQHRWAVWSEWHGEAAKLGGGTSEEQEHLRARSEEIARWETDNPETPQIDLPTYSGGRAIIVCWRPSSGPITPYYFQDEIQDAVDWLDYLETTYAAKRANALLLVGVTRTAVTRKLLQRLLRLTHPLFITGERAPDPRHWMPDSLS